MKKSSVQILKDLTTGTVTQKKTAISLIKQPKYILGHSKKTYKVGEEIKPDDPIIIGLPFLENYDSSITVPYSEFIKQSGLKPIIWIE